MDFGRRGARDAGCRAALWGVVAWLGLLTGQATAQEAGVAPAAPPPPPVSAAQSYANAVQSHQSSIPMGAIGKVVGVMILSLIWIATSDWVSRDSQIFELGYKKWNPIVFFPFAVLFIALSFLPLPFVARLPILAVVYLATIIPYVVVHNKSVQPHQTVLTGSWWRHFFASLFSRAGVKVSSERLADYEKGAPVELMAHGGADANQDNANLLMARQSPGYLLLKDLVADMIARRVEKVRLDYGPQGVAVRNEIDGMWHNGEARDRESADVMLAVMKTLANLDVKERRKKQSGRFGAKLDGKAYLCPLVCQGVQNGEAVVVSRLGAKDKPHTYESLGLREGLREQWGEFMARDAGLVIFSSLPGGGLTTMMDASLEETDRLMRDFISIEEAHRREREIQNIAVHTYDATKGETPATLMPNLVRSYPNVYVVRDFVDAESGKLLMNEIADDRLIITSIRARDAAEALLRMLAMKLPQKQFASVVTAVLFQKLIRKLCNDCKVGYQPTPDVLKKLGIPAGKVQQFYRPPKPEEREKPCQSCQALGYLGRTGIFELLVVTDEMRQVLAAQPTAEAIKKLARAEQQRSLQEEGILLVAKGVTSLAELQRVLKGE
jgi:type II secretory ATPase GspE/PulE/Tfp pilus assembly ATPase PilB-like protein